MQYIIDAGAMAATMGAGAAAVSNRYPSYPTLSQFNILLYPSTLSQFNILLYPRASPAAASRGTVTAPLPARGDGTAACPGRRRPAPARGYDRPDSKGLHSRRSGATAPASARGDGCPLPARGDGTAACPGRRRPAPARGYGRPDSKGPHSRRPGATAPASARGDGCPYAPS